MPSIKGNKRKPQTTDPFTQLGNLINNEVHKPSFQQGLQKTVQITAGVVALTPIGKTILKASVLAGDAGSHGGASAYLGLDNTNSTLDMVPGGLLSQQIANVATNGESGRRLNSTLPDPKRLATKDAKTLAITAVNNPSSLQSTAHNLAHNNVNQIKSTSAVSSVNHTLTKPTTTLNHPDTINKPSRPSLLTPVNKPTELINKSTLTPITNNKLTPMTKPSIHDLLNSKTSTLSINKGAILTKPSLIPKVDEPIIPQKNTLAGMSDAVTPPTSEIQQEINKVSPTTPTTTSTIKENDKIESASNPSPLIQSNSTLPINTSQPSTVIINTEQYDIFTIFFRWLSKLIHG